MTIRDMLAALGLLLLRLTAGLPLILLHGWAKVKNYSAMTESFPDPLGLGKDVSLGLAAFAEVFCAGAVVLGLFTRLAAIPPLIAMCVAVLFVHAKDTWATKEMALLYLGMYFALVWLGGGGLSLDSLLFKKKTPQ